MRRLIYVSALSLAAVLNLGTAQLNAQDSSGETPIQLVGHEAPGQTPAGQSMGHRPGGIFSEFDFMFLKLTQSEGVADATLSPASFDHKLVPRITLGYQIRDCFGIRARYWEHDTSTISASNTLVATDGYVVDLEAFQQFWVTYRTNLEVAFGARYTGFKYDRGADDIYTLNNAFGIVVSGQMNQVTRMGTFYGRARGGIVNGDGRVESTLDAQDLVRSQLELAVGLENSINLCGCQVSGRLGYEVQTFNNYIGTNDDDDQLTDIGLHGFLFGLGVAR